ncbi:MAG: UvrD-helicase domain-containing protein [Patescibacteria group bacterium]
MNLNPNQEKAVNHGEGPLLIVAGAGSGKTKTLTARVLRLIERGVPPEAIIAITFTNKAAKEMRARLFAHPDFPKKVFTALGPAPFVGTFHSLGARILREEGKALGRSGSFSIFDSDDALRALRHTLKDMNLDDEQYPPARIIRSIEAVKNKLLDPQEYFDPRKYRVFAAYENYIAKNNAFDFGDLIQKVVTLFDTNPEIKKCYNERYTHILVDEYQDVNLAQYRLVKLLAGARGNVSVVGDDAQAIYGWRHADFTNFLNFEKDWPTASVVTLEENYRSTETILTAANAVIKNNAFQKPKNLWTSKAGGPMIVVASAPNAEEESYWITEQIIETLRAIPRAERTQDGIAILYRTNAQSRSIESALVSAGIPYRIFGGVKFYERKEIKDIIAGLRIAANPNDLVSRERIEKTFTKKIGASVIEALSGQSPRLNILELITLFLSRGKYFELLEKKFPNLEERKENVNELLAGAADFTELPAFLEHASLMQSGDAENEKAAGGASVNLMTIHLAKGLEFDTVFIAGANEGLIPHQMSFKTREEMEEERRLMYVAMTRARKNLRISFFHIPSRFLYEIPAELTEYRDLGGRSGGLPEEDIVYLD